MILLRELEFAVGLFVVAFVAWQIVYPLLMGRRPFSKKSQPKNKEK
jgi:hypothetical protein